MVISREEQSQNQQIKRKVEKTSAVWMALNSWAEIMKGNQKEGVWLWALARDYCFRAYKSVGTAVYRP